MDDPIRKELLKAFQDIRVADARDGMDCLMRHASGSMDAAIRPLDRVRAFGLARTCRYIPYEGTVPSLGEEEYRYWSDAYYREVCCYPWIEKIQAGDFIVIDMSRANVGLMGSENTLACIRKGARGFVSDGGVRDTDEIMLQKIPFWSRSIAQTMVQGRLRYDADDVPVQCGGVIVHPGDVIVADGDGIIVVPQDIALDVARLAHAEHDRDKKVRANHYRVLGWKFDQTLG